MISKSISSIFFKELSSGNIPNVRQDSELELA
jgi:hypothetical protein